MNNFFIKGAFNKRKSKLASAGIPFLSMEIDGINGLVFEEHNIVKALEILNLNTVTFEETSIPGIVKIYTFASATVTFNPAVANEVLPTDETLATGPATAAEIKPTFATAVATAVTTEVTIATINSYKCNYWKILLENLKTWAQANITSVRKVIIHEGYNCRPDPEIKAGELHLVVGRHLERAGAKKTGITEYYPAQRLICIKNLGECPGNVELNIVINELKIYLPAVLAESLEAAESLMPKFVSVDNISIDGQFKHSKIEEIIKKSVPYELFTHVSVKCPHGSTKNPVAGDGLTVLFWSAPVGSRNQGTPVYMWGKTVGCNDASFAPSDTGLTVFDDQDHPVGEIVGNTLYIFHDACHEDRPDDYYIFEKIMEEAMTLLKLSPEERLARINAPKVVMNLVSTTDFNDPPTIKKATEEILLTALNRKIIFHYTGNYYSNYPITDGNFHIWMMSAASGKCSNVKKIPDKLFGFNTEAGDYDWYYIMPTEAGLEIIDPESQFIPAELLDNNLYVHIPLMNGKMTGGIDIYRKILELTVVELKRSPEEKALRNQEMKEMRKERSRQNFIDLCRSRQEVTLKKSLEELAVMTEEVNNLTNNIVIKVRREKELQQITKALKESADGNSEKFFAEFKQLYEIEGVESVKSLDDRLIIDTYNIFITTQKPGEKKDRTFDIGKFRIEIYFNGENGGLRFFNTTRQGKGTTENSYNLHHPHVNKSGDPCLGNITAMIGKLIAEYQFAGLTALALQFLESVNLDDDAGKRIFDCWPEVKTDEPIKEAS